MKIDYETDLAIQASYKHITRNCCCHIVVVKVNEQKEEGDGGIKVFVVLARK